MCHLPARRAPPSPAEPRRAPPSPAEPRRARHPPQHSSARSVFSSWRVTIRRRGGGHATAAAYDTCACALPAVRDLYLPIQVSVWCHLVARGRQLVHCAAHHLTRAKGMRLHVNRQRNPGNASAQIMRNTASIVLHNSNAIYCACFERGMKFYNPAIIKL